MAYAFTVARRAQLIGQWQRMKIMRQFAAIKHDAALLVAKKAMYQEAEKWTGVPWFMIAIIDDREGGIEHIGHRHLFNGDSLAGFTHQVPAGEPKSVHHAPPFTWIESAISALRYEKFNLIHDWTIELMLHTFEGYNGAKYYYAGRPSPYVWSCTNIYDPPNGPGGKVMHDNGPIENVTDTQLGCAPLIWEMAQLDKSIRLETESKPHAPVIVPHVVVAPHTVVHGVPGATPPAAPDVVQAQPESWWHQVEEAFERRY